MHCNICQRPSSTHLPFNCARCARDALYQTRLLLAHALLEHEAASSRIEHNLKALRIQSSDGAAKVLSTGQGQKHDSLLLESVHAQKTALGERTQIVLDHTNDLRIEIAKIREEVAGRRALNANRRSDLAAARQKLARREVLEVAPIVKSLGRIRTRWDTIQTKTAESRLLLFKEAASLYRLQKRRKHPAKSKIDGFVMGGLPIYHLRDLNNASPDEVTTVNLVLAHFVHLLSHYLSLRLPAEITLPHRDYPLPTILPPASSYTSLGAPLPVATPASSASNSPSASRALLASQALRPRPLRLKKQLSLLAKDEPQTYAAFVEGTTLLAWDIAWLCKTQGTGNGEDSWEDVCNIGKNLWKLVTAEQSGSHPASAPQDPQIKQNPHANLQHPAPTILQGIPQTAAKSLPTSFGYWSHDTVHSNLASAEHMRSWRLQDISKVIDRVKHMLLSDRTGAGWEILEGKEWETASMNPERKTPASVLDASTVVVDSGVGPRSAGQESNSGSMAPPSEVSQDKTKGTSGWTKLKSR